MFKQVGVHKDLYHESINLQYREWKSYLVLFILNRQYTSNLKKVVSLVKYKKVVLYYHSNYNIVSVIPYFNSRLQILNGP